MRKVVVVGLILVFSLALGRVATCGPDGTIPPPPTVSTSTSSRSPDDHAGVSIAPTTT